MSETRIVASGDAQIRCQSFGDPDDPALLLMMGQMASMLWWPGELCERLTATGRFVIRYDNRDTGLSTSYPPGQPPYLAADLAADAVSVLDGYGLDAAHLVGMSMGGALAQIVALTRPERVLTLTLISTTLADDSGGDLPGPTDRYIEHMSAGEDVDWSDTHAMAAYIVTDAEEIASTRHPFDSAAAIEFVHTDLQRTRSPESLINHAMLPSDEESPGSLAEIAAPTLVIHGSTDPLLPVGHGEALATAIPGAALLVIEGGGHELHPGDWDEYVRAIAEHTGG